LSYCLLSRIMKRDSGSLCPGLALTEGIIYLERNYVRKREKKSTYLKRKITHRGVSLVMDKRRKFRKRVNLEGRV
jgi:ribosomal protein L34